MAQPDPCVPTSAIVAAVRAVARMARALERSSPDLSFGHYRILAAIASGEERASAVAARLALGKPTVSAAVDALVVRGAVTATPSPSDARAMTLQLTQQGLALLTGIEVSMARRLEEILTQASQPDQILSSLADMGDALAATMVLQSTRK